MHTNITTNMLFSVTTVSCVSDQLNLAVVAEFVFSELFTFSKFVSSEDYFKVQ